MSPGRAPIAVDFLQWLEGMQWTDADGPSGHFPFIRTEHREIVDDHLFILRQHLGILYDEVEQYGMEVTTEIFGLASAEPGIQMWLEYLGLCSSLGLLDFDFPGLMLGIFLECGMTPRCDVTLFLQNCYRTSMRAANFTIEVVPTFDEWSETRHTEIRVMSGERFSHQVLHNWTSRQGSNYVSLLPVCVENLWLVPRGLTKLTIPTNHLSDFYTNFTDVFFVNSNVAVGQWLSGLLTECHWFRGTRAVHIKVTQLGITDTERSGYLLRDDGDLLDICKRSWNNVFSVVRQQFAGHDHLGDLCVLEIQIHWY